MSGRSWLSVRQSRRGKAHYCITAAGRENAVDFVNSLPEQLESGRVGRKRLWLPQIGTEIPNMDKPRPHSERVTQPASNEFELELEEIEPDVRHAAKKLVPTQAQEEELLDLTFTKPGESLLAKKSAYDRATSLAGSRKSWRRMREEFNGLGGQKQIVARAVVGVLALLVAVWLMRATWRAVTFVVNSGTEVARDVVGQLQPKVATLKESSQQFTDKMRELWNEIQPEEDEVAAVVAPKRGEAGLIDGEPWPGRDKDRLAAADFVEPTAVIQGILIHKGVALTQDGLGVFHVDKPMTPEKPSWIGGFGLLKKPGGSVKALLHGTAVHHAEDGEIFVARYMRGEMGDFWIVKGPEGKRVVVYVRTKSKGEKTTPDGAAFVLDLHRTDCLAFVIEDGEIIGAQWCSKKTADNGGIVYEPPADIVSLSALRANSDEFQEYESQLQQAIAELPELNKSANAELQKHKRKLK